MSGKKDGKRCGERGNLASKEGGLHSCIVRLASGFPQGKKYARIAGMETGSWQEIPDGSVMIRLDGNIYSESAAMKAVHEISATCSGTVSRSGEFIDVRLTGGDAASVDNFLRRANDHVLREKLDSQTGALRDVILAHAFSNTDLS
ncbi:MAG: hypothetical protein WCH98_07720 [Verrucomicrobiota bacterium]